MGTTSQHRHGHPRDLQLEHFMLLSTKRNSRCDKPYDLTGRYVSTSLHGCVCPYTGSIQVAAHLFRVATFQLCLDTKHGPDTKPQVSVVLSSARKRMPTIASVSDGTHKDMRRTLEFCHSPYPSTQQHPLVNRHVSIKTTRVGNRNFNIRQQSRFA